LGIDSAAREGLMTLPRAASTRLRIVAAPATAVCTHPESKSGLRPILLRLPASGKELTRRCDVNLAILVENGKHHAIRAQMFSHERCMAADS
jgi:hypothetical protein